MSVRGDTIAVGDYYYKNESAGRVFIYKLDPSSKSWNPVDGALVNPSCDRAFGRIVKFTSYEEMVVSCIGDSSGSVIYHYERQGAGKAYVLRQSIEFDTKIWNIAIDGEAMAVAVGRDITSQVIRFFMQTGSAQSWVQVTTPYEPTINVRQIALSGNDTLIASFQDVYLMENYLIS